MKNVSRWVWLGAAMLAGGCAAQEQMNYRALPAGPSLSADFAEANSWEPVIRTGAFLRWDDRYLHARFARPCRGMDPNRFLIRLAFDNGPNTWGREFLITHDGRCFDPRAASIGPVELPPEAASCRVSTEGRLWVAVVRIPLASIRALGNPVYMKSEFSGVTLPAANKPVRPIVEKQSGRIRFEFPPQPAPNFKSIYRPWEGKPAPATRPAG